MEYIYAALMLHRLGKPVDEAGIIKVIGAAGSTVDEAKLKSLIASLKDVDIEKELANASAVVAAPAAGGAEAPAAEEKKEEAKPEAAAEGLSALFG